MLTRPEKSEAEAEVRYYDTAELDMEWIGLDWIGSNFLLKNLDWIGLGQKFCPLHCFSEYGSAFV